MTSSLFSKRADEPPASLRGLLGSVIDYAGLFPPAALSVADAVEEFERVRHMPEQWMLGSFVVPLARLGELEEAAADRWQALAEGDYWSLSVILSSDPLSDLDPLQAFRDRWRGRAAVGALELPPLTPHEILALFPELPPDRSVYFETPLDDALEATLDAVATVGAFAKVRTGGLRAEKIPGLEPLTRFLRACRDRGIPFKATAGLHHPLRGAYRLRYEEDSPSAPMHGFLNLTVAAALLAAGAIADDRLCDVLADTDPAAFSFGPRDLEWRGHVVPVEGVERSRRSFFQSFGSCSFREPVSDLSTLNLL